MKIFERFSPQSQRQPERAGTQDSASTEAEVDKYATVKHAAKTTGRFCIGAGGTATLLAVAVAPVYPVPIVAMAGMLACSTGAALFLAATEANAAAVAVITAEVIKWWASRGSSTSMTGAPPSAAPFFCDDPVILGLTLALPVLLANTPKKYHTHVTVGFVLAVACYVGTRQVPGMSSPVSAAPPRTAPRMQGQLYGMPDCAHFV